MSIMLALTVALIEYISGATHSRVFCILMIESCRIKTSFWDFGKKVRGLLQELP